MSGSRDLPPLDDLPRSPTGRLPQWVVDEARGRLAAPPDVWRAGPPVLVPQPRRARRSRLVPVLVTVLSAAVLAASVVVKLHGWSGLWAPSPQAWQLDADALVHGPVARPAWVPPPGVEEAAAPLGTPPPVAQASAAFGFLFTQTDRSTPVAWDPCRPIHYVVAPAGAPAGGDRILADAVAEVSRATGLVFVADGVTDEVRTGERPLVQRERYGDRWAPVLVSWLTAAQEPGLAGPVVGLAGPASISLDAGPSVYVTGTVALDAEQFPEMLSHPDGDRVARAVVMHELGHLVGLRHVEDPTQVMYPRASEAVVAYGAGDLTGLATLGGGACAPQL